VVWLFLCSTFLSPPLPGEEQNAPAASKPNFNPPHAWWIRIAVASKGEDPEVVIPKEIEAARGALEKFAERSQYRKFELLKAARVPHSSTAPMQVPAISDLSFSFQLGSEALSQGGAGQHLAPSGKTVPLLKASWIKRMADSTGVHLIRVGGEVRKPYLPHQSLVLLGPPIPGGIAMAVLSAATESVK
jgi:hypothetical protein